MNSESLSTKAVIVAVALFLLGGYPIYSYSTFNSDWRGPLILLGAIYAISLGVWHWSDQAKARKQEATSGELMRAKRTSEDKGQPSELDRLLNLK